MRMEEYLNTVTEQIRCVRVREMISEELKDHILDQAKAYEEEGMFEEDAMEKAVRDMGDPVETGVSLDRIHRPQISAGLLVLIGLISLFSIALHALLGANTQEVDGAGYWYLRHHIQYILLGYALMLVIYRLDYSLLSKCARRAAAAFLLLIILGARYSLVTINGAGLYIRLGPVYLFTPTVMILFVPLYGGLLYAYRGQGYFGIIKSLLWAFAAGWLTFRIPSICQATVLWTTCIVLTMFAVVKGWYRVCRRWAVIGLGALFLAPVWFWFGAVIFGRLAAYQTARLRAFFTGSSSGDYFTDYLREILVSSRPFMGTSENLAALGKLPGFNNDYIFVSLIASYGVLAGILVVVLLLLLVMKIFRISLEQKNQLGMILGLGCGIVYLLQLGMSIAMPLGLIPSTAVIMPFFSSGGSGIVVAYILLGLVLSVYRYKNILPTKTWKERERGRLGKRLFSAWQSRAT